jgi:hypothetical protein
MCRRSDNNKQNTYSKQQSKQVVTNIASIVNAAIYSIANVNVTQGFYNQCGPFMPLCYPFDSELWERQFSSQQVSSAKKLVGCP